MYGKIYDYMTEEEKAVLNGRFMDLDVENVFPSFFGEDGACMSDLCGDDIEVAEVLVRATYRGLELDEDAFIYDGGQKNLQLRKYFSAKKIKALRGQTGLSQERFAKRVEMKTRTYQNYEEGQRIPSRLIVNVLKSAAYGTNRFVRSHRRLSLNLSILSEISVKFLDISMKGLYHFYWYVPTTRKIPGGGHYIDNYWLEARDKWEDSFGKVYKTVDYYPEDIAACILCAKEYGCDEILFEDRDHAIRGDWTADSEDYKIIANRIKEIQKELEQEKNEHREHTYKLIKDYLADEALGDPFVMLKWEKGLREDEILRKRNVALKSSNGEKPDVAKDK